MSHEAQQLSAIRVLQAAAFESISAAVVVCDPLGRLLLINQALRALLDLHGDAPLPEHLSDLPLYRVADDTHGLGIDDADYIFGDRTLRATPSPLIDQHGSTLGNVIVLRDVSDEMAAKAEVMHFIAAMSHELGKPLTPIKGNLDILLRGYVGPLSDEQTDMLQQARRWADHLNTAVRNTVTVASIESNQVSIDMQSLALARAVTNVLTSLKGGFAAKGINVQTHMPDDLPNVLADSMHLRQILTQLLDNACRFTPSGSVTISARPDDDMVRVEIADTGVGIPQAEQARLFTRFHWILRGDNSERGSGLGLYITRQLVERQGGRIWLTSSSKQGSIFSFVLPQAAERAPA